MSSVFTESLASFSKSAYQAFTEIENQARSKVAQDIHEARTERDQAVDALHALQLKEQEWKQEVVKYKSSMKQAEMTVAHQAETIAQLQREANQWKDQSRNWQEHFLRVEQERCRLTTRIEELVVESLQNRTTITPFIPHHQLMEPTVSTSSSTKRTSTSLNQPPAYKPGIGSSPEIDSLTSHKSISKPSNLKAAPAHPVDLPPYELPNSSLKAPAQTTRKRKTFPHSPARTEPCQTIIRRVQAVIQVKQEMSDEESGISESQNGNRPPGDTKLTKTQRRRRIISDDEGACTPDRDENDMLSEVDSSSEGGRDDEDDELMIGVEENHNEVYGTRRVDSLKTSHSTKGAVTRRPVTVRERATRRKV